MRGTVVGVLRGGPSSEHDVSLQTGQAIIASLSSDRYTVRDIFIDRSGAWHERGRPVPPEKVLRSIDVAVIGLHGTYGEDGQVQRLLECHGVPFTGSDHLGSFTAMHKVLAKERAKEIGLKTARYQHVESIDQLSAAVGEALRTFLQPVIVKPVASGSSIGVSLARGHDEITAAALSLLEQGQQVMIEERIIGREATAGVVEGMRGEALYALPPVEIIPSDVFFSYDAKYSGSSQEICPGKFSKKEKTDLMKAAKAIHEALGLRHYSRSDFIVSKRGVYYLETNTLPGMTGESLFPRPLEAVGVKFSDFLSHLVDLALKR